MAGEPGPARERHIPVGRRRLGPVIVAALTSVVVTSCGSTVAASAPAARAVLDGVVLSAPSCPVERLDSPCPPRPVDGAAVELIQGSAQRAVARTDSAGRFRLVAGPGTYIVRATNAGGLSTTTETRVTLTTGANPRVTLIVDSGIR